jgi:outer membrane efflux protein
VDTDVYRILEEKWQEQFGPQSAYHLSQDFTLPAKESIQLELSRMDGLLTLPMAVKFAAQNNQLYLMEKESLYTQALDLSLMRYQLRPSASMPEREIPVAISQMAAPGEETNRQFSKGTFEAAITTTQLADAWGLALASTPQSASLSFFQESLGNPLPGHVVQDVIPEKRIQAERNTLKQVRSFYHYRREFLLAEVFRQYYYVLQLQEATALARQKQERLQQTIDQVQNFLQTGRIQGVDLERARQDVLQARFDYLEIQKEYLDLLDDLKGMLGLSVSLSCRLDPKPFETLRAGGIKEPTISIEQAWEIALRRRLDLANDTDAMVDSARDVLRKAYDPDNRKDFIKGRTTESDPLVDEQLTTLQYLIRGLNLEFPTSLPYEQLQERNEFRRELISLIDNYREYEDTRESVFRQVQQAYRGLVESAQRYQLQEKALQLAENRRQNTMQLLQSGHANLNDVFNALKDIFKAKEQIYQSLTDYRLARVAFARDLGILQADSEPDSDKLFDLPTAIP